MVLQARAIPAAFANMSHQQWYAHVIDEKWDTGRKLTKLLTKKSISPYQWADAVHATLIEAHANASFIGRDLIKSTEFSAEDVLAARTVLDSDADRFLNFLDDILTGRYTDPDTGELRYGPIASRLNLYFGKVRGTAGSASVEASPPDSEIYWKLGGAEEHCHECPVYASISPFRKDDLFATPGSGDTPCLGNCKCHLEIRYESTTITTIKPVALTNEEP